MELIEQYYNKIFRFKGDPEFKDLTEYQINVLKKSNNFTFWKASKAGEQLAKDFKKLFRISKNMTEILEQFNIIIKKHEKSNHKNSKKKQQISFALCFIMFNFSNY